MSNDLLIKINADAANATKAFDDLRDKTSDLEDNLKTAALVSGAAFAALTAEVYFSVKAFEDGQKASIELTNALQNQGIYTDELKNKYGEYAEAVSKKTGIDDDQITKAQGIAQSFLGQTQVTEELTNAIADLGAKMGGDLQGAAEKIGRTIGTGTNAFARQGLVIDATSTAAERYSKVLDFVQAKAGGFAEDFNKADGYAKALTTAMDDFQKLIGAKFAPVIETARLAAIGFFNLFKDNPVLVDLAVAAIAAGIAVTGLILAVSLGVPAFLALSAAAAAFGIASNLALAGIPLLIGAIIAGITLLALNWDKSMAAVKAAAAGAVTLVSELFSGLGAIISGAFHLDPSKIKEGLNQITAAFSKSKDTIVETYQEQTASAVQEGQKQNQAKLELANKEAAQAREHENILQQLRKASLDLIQLNNEHASADLIALKGKEVETLKALDGDKSKAEVELLKEKLAEIRTLQTEQEKEDIQREQTFTEEMAKTKAELSDQGIQVDAQLREQKIADITAQAKTENDIDRDLQAELLTRKIQSRNTELLDRKKYGQQVATINKALNSDEVNGAKSAADGLVALSNSTNSTLKGIGKAAAITQIGIDTARGAMAVYANFQTAIPYPPVSIPLGIAAALALTAYGAERIGQVTGANQGGLITGGIPGIDSVPALLTPGELVVPQKNFDQVVGAVQGGNGSGEDLSPLISLLQSIDQKISTPQTTVIQGDVFADDSFIDSLVRKISDAVQYRNGKIFGVTT